MTNKKDATYFKESLGIRKVRSPERLRQRLDDGALGLRPIADSVAVDFTCNARVLIAKLNTAHSPLDCGVCPIENSQTKKDGVSHRYSGRDAYEPIAAYDGQEAWWLELELRKGNPHSQCELFGKSCQKISYRH